MNIFKEAAALHQHLQTQREKGLTIGFVPTMGALHPGHLSLIRRSKAENNITICSIFVNPTQFNNHSDFQHYPKTIEKDLEQLLTERCDVLFLPSVAEVYPAGHQKKHYDLGELEHLLEGSFRPGHFQGVCEVVDRLLHIVAPNTMYLGQKDYQQCMVIRRLLQITGRSLPELRIGDTLREADGLAMSSRNLRLSPADRAKATALYQALQQIRQKLQAEPLQQLQQETAQTLEKQGFEVDYVAICNADTLHPASTITEPKVALVAASLNGIRLIDNLPLN